MTSGIYKIINNINGKFYLGGTLEVQARFNRHKNQLSKGCHHSKHLQRSWDKHGPSNFQFLIVQQFKNISEEQLKNVQQKYLDELKPWDNKIGYNMSKTSDGGDLVSYHPDRQSICQKHRDYWAEMKRSMDQIKYKQFCKQKYSFPRDKNPNWKGGISKFTCLCGKVMNNCGQSTCNTCRDRSKDKNSFFGKKHSQQTKDRIKKTKSMLPKIKPRNTCKVVIDNIVYQSQTQAARLIGCSVATIMNRINNPKFKNYKLY